MNENILIVDDEKEIADLIEVYLKNEGFTVYKFYTGKEALECIESKDLDMAILDIMLPDFDGFQVLEMIREECTIPVLMLTAKSDDDSKIYGLKQGADDYLTKPFNINELKARVEAMVRRYIDFNQKSTDQSDILTIDGMQIDKENRIVKISDNNIELTNKEFDLLYFLASNKGRIFTKKQIYTNVWEEDYLFDDSNIMSFISKLRKKIEPNPEEPTYILTVRGVGYRFSKGV
ncbi:MAG: response regulator transcription factor [Finegoldia magna]|nr:response regulator transcription factor [Finegoldia magna]